MDQSNLILIEQHFGTSRHDFNSDTKIKIMERIKKIKSIIEKKR